jgi:hypothetical protein
MGLRAMRRVIGEIVVKVMGSRGVDVAPEFFRLFDVFFIYNLETTELCKKPRQSRSAPNNGMFWGLVWS